MRATRRGVATGFVAAVAVFVASSRAYSHTTLFSPNGDEQLISGDSFSILWEVTIAHDLENWDLWYSVVSDDGPWIDIVMDLPGGDPSEGSLHSYDWLVPNGNAPNAWVRVRMDNGSDEDYYDVSNDPFSIVLPNTLTCDFTTDGTCDVTDLNAMLLQGPVVAGVAVTAGVNDQFDLNGDQVINNTDVDQWLSVAASENGFGSPYHRGDANLDGVTDGQDFIAWNSNKFQANLLWDRGDFNGDGFTDGVDFIVWNENKFTASEISVVPEPLWQRWMFLLAFCALHPRARACHRPLVLIAV